LTRHDFGSSIVNDAPGLRTRLALDDLILFETTLVCGRGRTGFRSACEAGKSHLAADKDDAFQSLIDVQRARQRRIRPLSSSDTGYALKSDAAMEAEASADLPFEEPPPLRDDLDIENEPVPTTPEGRLERWRKRLLDLSGRNRLLNLP
ncbi:MAG: hypothetical protein ABSC06_31365, partial [Rhodopila sp.]